MACLSAAKRAELIARRDKLITQIAAMDDAIDEGIDRAHLSSIEFDSGDGKEKSSYRNINEVIKARDALELELARVNNRLCGRGVVNMTLRRNRCYGNRRY
jgi:hypothetical protein